MFKQHEIRNDVVLESSKGTQWELGNRKDKKSLPPLHTPASPPPPHSLSLLIGYIKILFPKQFDTIFNLD
jgi:hypothetical protein